MKEFKIKIDADWFQRGDVLETDSNGCKLYVVSAPRRVYRWYHKLLNILTFGLLFKVYKGIGYEYTVKKEEDWDKVMRWFYELTGYNPYLL